VDGSQPLVNPDGDPPPGDEPADATADGQRPALSAVPSVTVPAEEPDEDPAERDEDPGSATSREEPDAGGGVSPTFREIERRASAEIHRLAAESRREIAALRRDFPPPAIADDPHDEPPPVARSRFRLGRGRRPVEVSVVPEPWARRPRRPRVVTLVLVALAVVLLSVGSAYVYGVRLQPALYGAEATFRLTPRFELSDTAVDRETETQLLIVTSNDVLQPVSVASGVPLPTLQKEVSADMAGRSNVLVITVADRDRQRAITLADLVARQYAKVGPPLGGAVVASRPVEVTALTAATGIDDPLEPRPVRTVAAGLLVGILAALLVVVLLRRPWRDGRQHPYWT
jgi:hypothetical protein